MMDSFNKGLKAERERSYELYANEFSLTRDSGASPDEPHGRYGRMTKIEVNWMVSECCGAPATPSNQQIWIKNKLTFGYPYPYVVNHIDKEYFSGQCSKCKGYPRFSATYKTNIRKDNTGD